MRRKEIGGDSEAFGITRYRIEQEGRRLLGHRLPLGDKANLRLPVSSLNSLEISLPFDVLQEISQVVEELRHLLLRSMTKAICLVASGMRVPPAVGFEMKFCPAQSEGRAGNAKSAKNHWQSAVG